jgi:hypothetical protein
MMSRRIVMGLAMLGVLVCLAGCNKVSRKNFDKVSEGMSLAQVEKILGNEESGGPSSTMAGASEVLTWQEKDKSISVGFKDDRVMGKAATGL